MRHLSVIAIFVGWVERSAGPPRDVMHISAGWQTGATAGLSSSVERARGDKRVSVGRRCAWPTLLVIIMSALGCSTLGIPKPPETKLSQDKKLRDAEVNRRMTEQRDAAEFQSALGRWAQQDYTGCREQLDRLLARNPKHRDARLLLADLLVATGQPQEALAQVKQTLAAHPDDPDVHYAMGLMLDANGQLAEAVGHYERAARAEPTNEAYAMAYRTAQKAVADGQRVGADQPSGQGSVVSMMTGEAPPPAGPIVAAAASVPIEQPMMPSPPASRKMGIATIPGESAPAAVAASRAPAVPATRTGGDDYTALLQPGCQALAEGSPQVALAHFRQAAARRPNNPQILIEAATAALRANQPRVAIDLLAPLAKRNPPSATILRVLGTAYYRAGDYQLSQVTLQQALSLDKSNALSYFLMGCTLTKLGQLDGADNHFRQAQALDPRYAVQR